MKASGKLKLASAPPDTTKESQSLNERMMTAEILKFIPRNAKHILHLGKPNQDLEKDYLEFNPACQLTTLPELQKDIFKKNNITKDSLGAIIYNLALEYAENPKAVLEAHSPYLKADGVIAAIIPNAAHFAKVVTLWSGQGGCGQNPAHSFTLGAFTAILDAAGFSFVDAVPLQLYPVESAISLDAYLESAGKLAQAMGKDASRFRMEAGATHFMIRAVKKFRPLRRVLIHTLMLSPQAACNDLRVNEPHEFLSTIPGVACNYDIKVLKPRLKEHFKERVFIYQRPIMRYASLEIPRWMVRNNYMMIMEFDDHPMRWKEIADNRNLNFCGVHAVQTSTPELAEYFRQFNPNVAIFPNQLAKLPPQREFKAGEPVTVFFGALNREEDWALYMPILNRAIEKHGSRLRFNVVYDSKFHAALKTDHKTFTPLCGYAEYRAKLGMSDISFMPLSDNLFNSMKSDLKYIEAAGHGAVALASPTVYRNVIKEGGTGLIFRSEDELEKMLDELITNDSLRVRIANEAYHYVASSRLQYQHYKKRYDWYMDLLDNHARLTAELKERVPEYFTDAA